MAFTSLDQSAQVCRIFNEFLASMVGSEVTLKMSSASQIEMNGLQKVFFFLWIVAYNTGRKYKSLLLLWRQAVHDHLKAQVRQGHQPQQFVYVKAAKALHILAHLPVSDARAKLFSGFGRAGPGFFGPRAGRAFDKNYFGRANGP